MPKAVKKQLISVDGEWIDFGSGGEEVSVQNDEPVELVDLWVDLDEVDDPLADHAAAADPHPQYVSRADAAVRDHALLGEAVWWGDAAASTGTRLRNLAGLGSVTINAARSATIDPSVVVLPHLNEDYLLQPQRANSLSGMASVMLPKGTVIRFDMAVGPGTNSTNYVLSAGSAEGCIGIYFNQSSLYVRTYQAGTARIITYASAIIPGERHRYVVSEDSTGKNVTVHRDGTSLGAQPWPNSYTRNPTAAQGMTLCTPSGYSECMHKFYRIDINGTHIMDPRNAHSGYRKIRNAGTAGGDWNIGRAGIGSKIVVVDRPLILTSNDDGTQGVVPISVAGFTQGSRDRSWVVATRKWGISPLHGQSLVELSATDDHGVVFRAPANTDNLQGRIYDGSTDPASYATIDSTWSDGQAVHGVTSGSSGTVVYLNGVRGASDPAPRNHDHLLELDIGLNTSMEFIAAAVFDRVLSDAEMAQVSEEILVPYPVAPAKMDTGWRHIVNLLVNGWADYSTPDAYPASVRRIGNVVHMNGLITSAAAQVVNVVVLTLPSGFRPGRNEFWLGNRSYVAHAMSMLTSGAVRSSTAHAAGTQWISLAYTWVTDDPWPSHYPGRPLT